VSVQAQPLRRVSGATVRAERPQVALRVTGGERARRYPGTEGRLMWWLDDLGVRSDRSVEDRVRIVGDDVSGACARSHPAMDAVDVLGRSEHERAAARPAHLGVDHVSGVVADGESCLETERLDKEAQRRVGVVVVQHRPDGRRRVGGHEPKLSGSSVLTGTEIVVGPGAGSLFVPQFAEMSRPMKPHDLRGARSRSARRVIASARVPEAPGINEVRG
jgi:hypothetical protein